MPNELLSRLREDYPRVAKGFVGPLLDVLAAGREACGGDLDRFHVLLVIAQRTAEDRRTAGLSLDDMLSGRVEELPSLTTNVRSIAESTGIPKETVRRKVAALVAEGLVRREGNELSYTRLGLQRLSSVREPILRFAVRGHQAVAALDLDEDPGAG